jgi:4-amino-4-deoxy-L-arabinose transferase-like glycosyltransferase
MRTRRSATLCAAAIIAGGLALRLAGIDSSLPFIYDPDEPDFVNRAFRMWETGNLDPGWFGHPGSTTIYAFLLAFSGYAALWEGTSASLAAAFRAEPSAFFLMARLVIVGFGTATLWMTWLLARRLAGNAGGLLAAALLAAAPLHVQFSRIARPDLQMGFLSLASLWFALSIATAGRWRDYVAAGFLLGLAVATKYPSLVFAVVIVIAHCMRIAADRLPPWRDFSRLAAAGLATAAGVVAGSPYLLASLPVALADIATEARTYHLSATSQGFLASADWYLRGPLLGELGIVGALLATVGIWSVIRHRDRAGLLVLSSAVIFVAFIATLSLRWDRWVLPAVPLACVLAGVGFGVLANRISDLPFRPAAIGITLAVGLMAVAMPAANSLPWTFAAARGDSRDRAYRWIVEHVPAGSRLLGEAYTPQLPAERYRLYTVADGKLWRLDPGPRRYAVPEGVIGTLRDPAAIVASIDYVILANHYDRRLAEASRYQRQIGVYEQIMAASELVYEAHPGPWVSVGLPVRVYRVRR